MRGDRFRPPAAGPAESVAFPAIARARLATGLSVWVLPHAGVPMVHAWLLVRAGAIEDPPDRPGLAGLTASLGDEGAGGRDAIELADAFARLGTRLTVDVSGDVAGFHCAVLARFLAPALALVADVVAAPHFDEAGLDRLRDLRLNRLRQLSRSAGAAADRAFRRGVFDDHPYGRGVLGTSRALAAVTLDDVGAFHRRTCRPERATLILAGDLTPSDALAAAGAAFDRWAPSGPVEAGDPPPSPGVEDGAAARVWLVDRPGAPQAEVRVGHAGPPRATGDYHALVTLNAALGGLFSSRVNQNLRETRGITYGARTGLVFHRRGGLVTAETNVDVQAAALAVAELRAELDAVREGRPVTGAELLGAKESLTRGYVRQFETASDLARAAAELATFDLADDTFDRFVPGVTGVTDADVLAAARRHLHPGRTQVVVVADLTRCRAAVEALGLPVADTVPEF